MAEAQNSGSEARDMRPTRLRDALRQARIEAADRTGVVVECGAEVARLRSERGRSITVAEVPSNRQFRFAASDRARRRGCGSTWWRMVMGATGIYRFVQDTRSAAS